MIKEITKRMICLMKGRNKTEVFYVGIIYCAMTIGVAVLLGLMFNLAGAYFVPFGANWHLILCLPGMFVLSIALIYMLGTVYCYFTAYDYVKNKGLFWQK